MTMQQEPLLLICIQEVRLVKKMSHDCHIKMKNDFIMVTHFITTKGFQGNKQAARLACDPYHYVAFFSYLYKRSSDFGVGHT